MVLVRPKLRRVEQELTCYAVFAPNIGASVTFEGNIGSGGRRRHHNDVVRRDPVKGDDFVLTALRPGDNSGRSRKDLGVEALPRFPVSPTADLGKTRLDPVLQIIRGGDIWYGNWAVTKYQPWHVVIEI